MIDRHKVFITYHHENDEDYRRRFEKIVGDNMVNCSVDLGDIDPDLQKDEIYRQIRKYISDATVIVVLIGSETWKRKYVDWEIYSALRNTDASPRCGILGVFLPNSCLKYNEYDKHQIPPRLSKNVDNRYGILMRWSEDSETVKRCIDDAFKQRNGDINPDLSDTLFRKNHVGERWND